MEGPLTHYQYDTFKTNPKLDWVEPAYVSFSIGAERQGRPGDDEAGLADRRFQLGLSGPAVHAGRGKIRVKLDRAVAPLDKHRQSTRVSRRNFTIDDVAREAGVARVTVSRVLNNVQNVRPETRERVRRAVEALGYSVNRQARALASGSGTQIMLIHAHNPEREPNSFYNAGLELGALRACSSLGFDLVTRAIDPASESPARLLASILEHERPAGIVVSPPLSDDLELLACAQAGERADGGHIGWRARPVDGLRSRDRRTRSREDDLPALDRARASPPGLSERAA